MEVYDYKDLSRAEKIACVTLAIYTLFSSGNLEITVEDIENEVDVICRVYKRNGLINTANNKLSEQRRKKNF